MHVHWGPVGQGPPKAWGTGQSKAGPRKAGLKGELEEYQISAQTVCCSLLCHVLTSWLHSPQLFPITQGFLIWNSCPLKLFAK